MWAMLTVPNVITGLLKQGFRGRSALQHTVHRVWRNGLTNVKIVDTVYPMVNILYLLRYDPHRAALGVVGQAVVAEAALAADLQVVVVLAEDGNM